MVTLQDIADKLGLSRATVCLAMKDAPGRFKVNDKTRDLVRKTALEMGYRPNHLARAVITGKSHVIGFYSSFLGGEYTAKILAGAMRAATAGDYSVKLLPFADFRNIDEALDFTLTQRLDGIIWHSTDENDEKKLRLFREKLLPFGVPIAIADNSYAHDWGIHVRSDDMNGMGQAVRHLRELGHRAIAFVTDAPEKVYSLTRQKGWEKAIGELGLDSRKCLSIGLKKPQTAPEEFLAFFQRLERSGAVPTAYCCETDSLALVLVQAFQSLGRNVPGDFSVTGFADLSFSQTTRPRLTTVDQNFMAMGARAADLLIHDINSSEKLSLKTNLSETVPTTLIVRESSGKPRGKK